jgi:hypothetical protein
MLFKIKEKIRNLIIYLFMAPKNKPEKLASTDFSPENYQKKYIANSTVITMYHNDERTLFFRECRRHQKLYSYLCENIKEYFDKVCQAKNKEWLKKAVLQDLSKKENYKKAIHITSIFNYQLMEILSGTYCDYSATGFECFKNHDNNDDFIAFIQYFSCVLISHQTNAYLKAGQYQNFNANKQLATYKLSALFGIQDIIPAVWFASFCDDGRNYVGTLMDKASGMPPSDILPKDRLNYNKKTFLKDITNLEYFDAICYQLDHRLDNYYVTQDENGVIDRVVAFDNDAARTFFVSPNVPPKTYADASSVISGDGTVRRPYMDKDFKEKLMDITKNDLKNCVGEYLSGAQLYCLNKRIETLKKAVEKTLKSAPDFLVSDWGSVNVDLMADSKWGKTYFNLYLNDTLMLDRKEEFAKIKKQ